MTDKNRLIIIENDKTGNRFQTKYALGLSVLDILVLHDVNTQIHCGGNGTCGRCKIKVSGELKTRPTATEIQHLTEVEIKNGIRLACQLRPEENLHIKMDTIIETKVLRKLQQNELLPIDYHLEQNHLTNGKRFGIAVDFGTTQVKIALWDLYEKKRISAISLLNPLTRFGSDILIRISKAVESASIARKMSELCLYSIKECINDFVINEDFNLDELQTINIVANTAMLSLLSEHNYELLVNPDYWMKEVEFQSLDVDKIKTILEIPGNINLNLIPTVAGFIGSDLLAAVLYTKLYKKNECSLLVDFGTNSEIALWDTQTLRVTSAAGGPAFDGCGLTCGMPAEPGAVYHLEPKENSDKFNYHVIGNKTPLGICGSGIVDAIAGLIKTEFLRTSGQFSKDYKLDKFTIVEGSPNIVISKKDVDIFQRAKAAIAAGIVTLLSDANIQPEKLQTIYICGAFGQYLNIINAQLIGLLPTLPLSKLKIFNNAALAGCEELLFYKPGMDEIKKIKNKTKIINLATSTFFESIYTENLYLKPITNI